MILDRYVETSERLQREAGIVLSKFKVADNMDLLFMLQVRSDASAPQEDDDSASAAI